MPLYFFHLHECGIDLDDTEGHDFATLEAARTQAITEARSIMAAEVLEGRLCLACYIDIASASAESLDTVAFRDVLVVTGLKASQ